MVKSTQIIEINGKKYDAHTGRLVSGAASNISKPKRPASQIATKPTAAGADIKRTTPAVARQVHKRTQRSQTLMRSAVKRPVRSPAVKTAHSKSHPEQKQTAAPTAVSPLTKHMDLSRIKRAEAVKRSNLVSKFGSNGVKKQHPLESSFNAVSVAPMEVRPAPKSLSTENKSRVHTVLENGLKQAESHKQSYPHAKRSHKPKTKKSKLVSYGASALAFVLLTGFIAYQNIPNLSMRYASTRSGVSASLPGYQPSGFSLNRNIEYNPGQITLEFSSNSDDREFRITQRETSWNSESLYSNYVLAKSDQVQKYEDKGRTIYLYGDNNATWVNGGIWYDINGDSQLNSDQLIRIATSM